MTISDHATSPLVPVLLRVTRPAISCHAHCAHRFQILILLRPQLHLLHFLLELIVVLAVIIQVSNLLPSGALDHQTLIPVHRLITIGVLHRRRLSGHDLLVATHG